MRKTDHYGFYTTEHLLEMFKTDTTKEDYMTVTNAPAEMMDDIYAAELAEQEKVFETIEPHLKKALHNAEEAMVQLHETGDYESCLLDTAASNIENAIRILTELVKK